MSECFIGQIMMAGFGFAPKGWALCNGQLLPINQNQALFSLLGTQYGGDGRTNFALPDLRGRTPLGYSQSVPIGQAAGVEDVTLQSGNLPPHTHGVNATTANSSTRNPRDGIYAGSTASLYGAAGGAQVTLDASTLAVAGGSQPHPNLQPYTTINFCIALQGIFPSRD